MRDLFPIFISIPASDIGYRYCPGCILRGIISADFNVHFLRYGALN